MVLSDALVYFLKIEKTICRVHQNYPVALISYKARSEKLLTCAHKHPEN